MKWKALFFIIFIAFLIYAAIKVHPFGEIEKSKMDDYIIKNAQQETGANNVVTSVVFDYRGYDRSVRQRFFLPQLLALS